MSDEKKEGFEYGYSAPTAGERREIEGIRNKYLPAGERQQKLERLKMLDRKVKRPAVLLAAVLGVCGTLLFGLGLSMVLEWAMYLWGSAVCLVGAALAAVAVPLYRRVYGRRKKKYAEEILRLSSELLNE